MSDVDIYSTDNLDMLRHLLSLPMLVCRWFYQYRVFWITTLFFGLCLVLPIVRGGHQRDFRISSTVLQFVGVWQVIYGIEQTRKSFGKDNILKTLLNGIKEAIRALPSLRRRSVNMYAGIGIGGITLSASATTTFIPGDDPNASIEDRISALGRAVKSLGEQLHEAKGKMNEVNANLSQQINEGRAISEANFKDVSDKLIATNTGGLSLSLIGAISIFLGLAYAVLPDVWFYCCRLLPD